MIRRLKYAWFADLCVRHGPALLLAAIFVVSHARSHGLPAASTELGGWGNWSDQGRYIAAARAWADGDLSASRHHYVPGYALTGAWLSRLTPRDRFYLPDLASLVIGLYACAALARRLFPRLSYAGLVGAGAFLLGTVGTAAGRESWIVPWTTTPAAALTYVALVAVLRLNERPDRLRGLLAGAAVGGIVLFRPAEMAPVAFAAALVTAPTLLRTPWRRGAWVTGAIVLGAAVPLGLTAGLVAATTGFGQGTYLAASRAVGFEVRLIPLRWVIMVLSPRPLFDGVGYQHLVPRLQTGLANVFPWIIPGFAGLIACCVGSARRRVHILLAVWLLGHFALLLSYRDLHVLGLWFFLNYHYFKAVHPVLVLFAVAIPLGLADGTLRWRASAAAVIGLVALAFWRVELTPAGPAASTMPPALPDLSDLASLAIVTGTGPWQSIYGNEHRITVGGRLLINTFDFKLYPRGHDLLVIPLRPFPPGQGTLSAVGLDLAPNIASASRPSVHRIRVAMPLWVGGQGDLRRQRYPGDTLTDAEAVVSLAAHPPRLSR